MPYNSTMSLEKLDPEAIAEQIDAELNPKGGSGGAKKVFGSEHGRRKKKGAEAKEGQRINAAERHDRSEKSPKDEIADVVRYLIKQDGNDQNLSATSKYIEWLTSSIDQPDIYTPIEQEFGNWIGYTASVKAGGGGRQTSNNARRRTHLITGITAEWEKSRKADPNQEQVMRLVKERIITHLHNWRQILFLQPGQKVSDGQIQTEINKFL